MVTGTEGSAEGCTSLTISHKRIGKEERSLGGKPVSDLTGLAHETILHLHRIVDRAAVADNRILADHARTDKHRGVH